MTNRREQVIEQMLDLRLTAIIRTNDAVAADAAARAAMDGGFRMIEFTMNTPQATRLIGDLAGRADLLVGAGTVLTTDDARAAVDAGARFLVSPCMDPAVIRLANELDVASMPGCSTPTEMWAAHNAGADFVKVFPAPAEIPTFVKQVRGPLPQLRLFPTAGVTPENFISVLNAGAAGVGFVTPLFPPDEIAAGQFKAIEQRAARIQEAFNQWKAQQRPATA